MGQAPAITRLRALAPALAILTVAAGAARVEAAGEQAGEQVGERAEAGGATGEIHVVRMLNRHPDHGIMVFDPPVLSVEPGDRVQFVPTTNGHNAQSIDGLIPEGAEPWRGRINQEITVEFAVPGAYAYKCLPHYGTGMIGLVVVGGSLEGLDRIAAEDMPGSADQRLETYVEIARGLGS